MPNLKLLRQRIASVGSTLKITSAMKMVAASKLKRLQQGQVFFAPFEHAFKQMISHAKSQLDPLEGDLKWFSTRETGKIALIVVSSSRGLCGSFNNMIIKETKSFLKKMTKSGQDVEIFFVGRKAKDSLTQFMNNKYAYQLIQGTTNPEITGNLSKKLLEKFFQGEYKSAHVIFNDYKSTLVQTPTLVDLLPLSVEEASFQGFCEIEPDVSSFLESACPKYLEILILKSLIMSHVGEQAARMIAMDSATRAAKDMVHSLKLQFNRTRQNLITKELIEVISGAEGSL